MQFQQITKGPLHPKPAVIDGRKYIHNEAEAQMQTSLFWMFLIQGLSVPSGTQIMPPSTTLDPD